MWFQRAKSNHLLPLAACMTLLCLCVHFDVGESQHDFLISEGSWSCFSLTCAHGKMSAARLQTMSASDRVSQLLASNAAAH